MQVIEVDPEGHMLPCFASEAGMEADALISNRAVPVGKHFRGHGRPTGSSCSLQPCECPTDL